ncbi:MAG: ABC transporter permease [bacterium]
MEIIGEYFFIAIRSIKTRFLRSLLTVLGIIMGVFLIIALFSISEGLKTTIDQQLQSLGGEMVMIMPGSEDDLFSSMIFGGEILQKEDIEAIKKARYVDEVIGYSFTGTVARFEGEAKQLGMSGYDPWPEVLDIMDIFQGWSLSSGRWPQKGNEILAGSRIETEMFSKKVKAGSEITIKGKRFIITGILNSLGSQQDDSMIYMDMETFQDLTGEKRGTAAYAMATFEDGIADAVVAAEIKESLAETRKRRSGTDEADFSVITSDKMGEITGEILGIIQTVIIILGGVAVIVGGIGITNSMFTSVRERTREIGIMKAIGATNSAVLSIFLIEAGIIGILGGVGGLILGSITALSINYYSSTNPSFYLTATIAPWMVIFSLFFSFFIGCLAGFFPAKKASSLKPVDALRRYE